MEWNERIAFVRKAAGLTQEQLGQLLGVTRQAVSKWESAQTVPDAVTIARLCEALHVSADFVLLGKEPEQPDGAGDAPPYALPDTCPCCGRPVSGTICPVCGYTLPTTPPRGPRYAIVASRASFVNEEDRAAELVKYCGMPESYAKAAIHQMQEYAAFFLLRRNLTDGAAQWIAAHLDGDCYSLRIVRDDGEESNDALLTKPKAMELPAPAAPKQSGLGFWGVVGAVIVALLILSFF